MAKQITQVSIFLSSPADVKDDSDLVIKFISDWNQKSSSRTGIIYDVYRWDLNVSASFGEDGQQIINKQIGDEYDVLIALFWKTIGSPTSRARSGTVEEYERALARFKEGDAVEIAFLFKSTPIDFKNEDLKEIDKVNSLEREIQTIGGLTKRFSSNEALQYEINLILDRIAKVYSANLLEPHETQSGHVRIKPKVTLQAEEERGLFDVSESLSHYATLATANMASIASGVNALTDVITTVSNEITVITSLRSLEQGEAKGKFDRVSQAMDTYSGELDHIIYDLSENLGGMVSDIRDSIKLSVDFRSINDGDDGDINLNVIERSVDELIVNMGTTLGPLDQFIDTITSIKRVTTNLNKSKRKLSNNLTALVSLIQEQRSLLIGALQDIVVARRSIG